MADLDGPMERLSLRGGRVQRGSRVMGGWSDHRGGARGRGDASARGRGGWWRGGSAALPEDDLRHRLNQPAEDLRVKLNANVNRDDFDDPYTADRREKLLGLDSRSKPKKNTESFVPSHEPTEMRLIAVPSGQMRYGREISTRDVIMVPDLFCKPSDLSIYEKLLKELSESGLTEHQIWSSWHGDSHLIANDQANWKRFCPTFHMVLDKIRAFFNMDIKATRLNWYRDSSEWKPFHHDAAAIKEEKAKQSNLTVAVSFGLERDAAFEHAKTKTVISMPQPNGSAYVFARDINVLWRHGILQAPPTKRQEQGRISVIAWGWTDQTDA